MRVLWVFFALCAAGIEAEEARLYLQLGHSNGISSVAFSADGRLVLTGSWDGTARLWDAASGDELRCFEGIHDYIRAVAFSPDGRFVLAGAQNGEAEMWEAMTGTEVRRFTGHSAMVDAVAFSPDGHYVLTGSLDNTARLWDAASGAELRRFTGHSYWVTSVAFSPGDGRSVLTGSWDGTTRLWDTASGAELRRMPGYPSIVAAVAFASDGRFIATAYTDYVALFDASTGAELRRFGKNSGGPTSVAISPDGRYVLTGGLDKTARLWDASSGAEVRRFAGHSDRIYGVAFSPDGQTVLTGSADEEARLWDAGSGKVLHRFQGMSNAIRSVSFSPNGKLLLIGGDDRSVRLWDAGSGGVLRRLASSADGVNSVAFSADGRLVAGGGDDKIVRLWDAATGAQLRSFAGHSEIVTSVAFSPDGRFVLTGSRDNTARLWDAATGTEVQRLVHPEEVRAVAFSADGRFVLTGGSDGKPRLWDAATGAEIRRFEGHSDSIPAVAISRDGRLVLAGGADGDARLWDAASGQELRSFVGHQYYVNAVAFSPDGRLVLTGSADYTARLWDTATGKMLFLLTGHGGDVDTVAFSPDGRMVLTGSEDGSTRLWSTANGAWLATIESSFRGGWAVVDPAGRYDAADPDSAPGLHFVAGNDVIEVSQLKQRFYTPGLLARIWRGEKLTEIAGSLKNVKLVPGVEVSAPQRGSLEAMVRLTNRGGGIGKVIVKVNGRELPAATRGVPPDVNAKSVELQLNLGGATLSPTGKNVIEVYAENGDGVIRSRALIHEWDREPPRQTSPPRLFAIVAGVSSYDDPSLELRYSAKDAVNFGHALELAARGLFGKDRTDVTVLASGGSEEPTKENIRRAFDRVAKEARASDLLVVYFAGHAFAVQDERDQYYYLTKEARRTIDRDPGLRAVSAISSAELKDWLWRTNMPLKQVVILDTCAAGAAFGDMVKLADRRELSPDQIRAIELLKDSTGSWILMGSAADAVSYEANRYAQGLLTYALLEGMQGQALEEDRVEVSKLFAFTQRQVEELARGIGGIQRPVLSAPKGQSFPIGLLTAEDRKQIHVATLKPQLLRARVLDDNDLDSLKLEPALRAALRAASVPVTRGSERQDPQIVYLDSVVDEVPDALIPQIRYTVVGDRVKIRLRLLQNGKAVVERNLDLAGGDAGALSRALLPEIVAASGKVK